MRYLLDNNIIVDKEDYNQMYIEWDSINIRDHHYISQIIFGPKAKGFNLFRDVLTKTGLDYISCKQSKLPLA